MGSGRRGREKPHQTEQEQDPKRDRPGEGERRTLMIGGKSLSRELMEEKGGLCVLCVISASAEGS